MEANFYEQEEELKYLTPIKGQNFIHSYFYGEII